MTEAQKKAAKARFKRDGGIGKKKKGTTTKARSKGGSKGVTSSGNGKFKKNTSFVTLVIGAGLGVEAVSVLGFAVAQELQSRAMELAAMIGITSGAGLLAAAVALKAANTKRAARIPLLGGGISIVGSTWAGILSDFNLRP